MKNVPVVAARNTRSAAQTDVMQVGSDGPEGFTDRRSEQRRKSSVNKIVRAEVRLGEEEELLFLYLVDVSPGGMRVNLDRTIEPESTIDLTFPVKAYFPDLDRFEARCRVAWNRELLGGTCVHGLEFLNLTAETSAIVERLFSAFSPEGKRSRFRLNKVLSLSYFRNNEWRSWSACDLSPEGLGMQMRDPLPMDEVFPFRIYLEDEGKYSFVELNGEIVYAEELDEGLHRLGVKFRDPDPSILVRIQAYMDRCLSD